MVKDKLYEYLSVLLATYPKSNHVNIEEHVIVDTADLKHIFIQIESLKKCFVQLVNGEKNEADITSKIYQLVRLLKSPLVVSSELYDVIVKYMDHYKLEARKYMSNQYSISMKNIYSDEFDFIFELNKSKRMRGSIADPWFIKNFRTKTYKSESQKRAIDFVIHMPPKKTVLVTLPTGGGKSYVGLAMAKYFPGLTVIIVPTISLMIDQFERYKNLFAEGQVECYYSSTSKSIKEEILKKIVEKKVRILYLSPESLTQGAIGTSLREAAKLQYFNQIIIDECHLITDWGNLFRPDFQFLGSFQRIIKEENSSFRTLLLSATITNNDEKIISRLFGNNDLIIYRADALRKEIVFTFKNMKNAKYNAFTTLIAMAPKPMIIYARKPETVYNIETEIQEILEYKRIAAFTGKTKNNKREKIINQWNNDQLDIIIATSAFGMGVDKDNVRTVLHYDYPSTLKEYYQEVGRSGRDGLFSCALSLLDYRQPTRIKRGLDLTDIRFIQRWFALIESRQLISTDQIYVNLESTPADMYNSHIGSQNIKWNEYVLLVLEKNDILSIGKIERSKYSKIFYALIVVKDNSLLFENEITRNKISRILIKERAQKSSSTDRFRNYLRNINEMCFSEVISEELGIESTYCAGCNYCGRRISLNLIKEKYKYSNTKEISGIKYDNEFGNMPGAVVLFDDSDDYVVRLLRKTAQYISIIYYSSDAKKLLRISETDISLPMIFTNRLTNYLDNPIHDHIIVVDTESMQVSEIMKLSELDCVRLVLVISDHQQGQNKSLKDELRIVNKQIIFEKRLKNAFNEN